MRASFRLDDAERLHRAAPRTFSIPRRERRTSLGRGDLVKLVFRLVEPADDGRTAERMWCRISVAPENRFGSGFRVFSGSERRQ